MRYDTATLILKNLPNYWSTESTGLKPEYAKPLLKYALIEEVEPGRYRNTVEGTRYANRTHWAEPLLVTEMKSRGINFVVEEIDFTPQERFLAKAVLERQGQPNDPESIEKYLRSHLGDPWSV